MEGRYNANPRCPVRILAIIILIVGIALLGYSLVMDTSVEVDYPPGGRVHNLGLMQKQQNMLILGGILFLGGLMLLVVIVKLPGRQIPEQNGNEKRSAE